MTSKLMASIAVSVSVLVFAATGEATEFSGSWKGTLTGADGSAAEVQIDFSPQGFPLRSYCIVLRGDGISDGDCVEQVAYLLSAGKGFQHVLRDSGTVAMVVALRYMEVGGDIG
jgi:hypothetical protein